MGAVAIAIMQAASAQVPILYQCKLQVRVQKLESWFASTATSLPTWKPFAFNIDKAQQSLKQSKIAVATNVPLMWLQMIRVLV